MEHQDIFVDQSCTGKRWEARPYREKDALAITQQCETPELISRLIASRGVDCLMADAFLNPTLKASMPDPDHLKDMNLAVELVANLVINQKTIGVFGDYDVDGATASSLLVNYFDALGIKTFAHIPDRIEEGYGPNIEAMRKLKNQGCAVVLTVDCGTTSFDVLEQAHNEGIDVIVLDHHGSESELPRTKALINPNRWDEDSALTYVSAVGLVYLFIVALNRLLRLRGFFEKQDAPDLLQFLDLVALGTVCDVVPLIGLNRAYVRQGLKVFHQRQNLGLKTLCDVVGIHQKISAYHLGFVIGPRINAGGRVGSSNLGLRLLTTKDPLEALDIARKLDALNKERQQIELQALDEAYQMADAMTDDMIIVDGQWHQGIIGIVAGRLKERYHKPTLVITFDEENIGKGSGRSIEGIDLGSLMHAAKAEGLLINGGGHAMAAGFTIHRDKVQAFKVFMNERLKNMSYKKTPVICFDGFLTLNALNEEFMCSLDLVAPFGQSNPSPLFVLNDLFIKKVDLLAQGHISCILNDLSGKTIKAFAFKAMDSDLGPRLLKHEGKRFHFIGSPKINAWGGQETIQFTIQDVSDVAKGNSAQLKTGS
ncbi:MAG: single-stranded-DNA-specific exonuclease RecJ [Candidatus Nucleicultricaceae bacterium]